MLLEISTMGAPQLNIKDAETTRMVRELAEMTGETQTEVVRKAVEERLSREKSTRGEHQARREEEKRREFEEAWAKIKKVQEEVRRLRLGDNMLTDDDLYDENGLPK
jgi:antitoxin VapB